MTYSIPIIDLEAATRDDAPQKLLDQVRAATEEAGILQVVNHGVPQHLIDDFDRRVGRLLGLPRARKAELASPTGHPYRGWRQWPDDFGRLELERFNVGQFDNAADARAAGLPEEYLGLYAHANVWPADDPGLRDLTHQYIAASRGVAERVLGLYARAQDLPADTFPIGPLPYLTLTVNNYPTWTYPDTGRDEDKLLLLEHADGSAVTVLAQQGGYEGLQIQLPDADWLPVPVVPGALQVFSGPCSPGGATGCSARPGTAWWPAAASPGGRPPSSTTPASSRCSSRCRRSPSRARRPTSSPSPAGTW
jgi:isopenicillin N synthase-like dioxygenase